MRMPPEESQGSQRLGSVRPAFVPVAALVLVALLAGTASAQNTTQLTVEAREDCPETTFCFEITGALEDAEPGDVLDITLVNPEDNLQVHNVHLALSSEANVGEEEEATEPRVAFASTEDVSPGNETTLSAEIPEDAEGVYLWCTIRAHEQQGMFRDAELAGVEEGANGSPGLATWSVLLAMGGLAALTRDR